MGLFHFASGGLDGRAWAVLSAENFAGKQGEVLAARHIRSSLGSGSWGDEVGDEVPSDDDGRGLWRSDWRTNWSTHFWKV